MSDANPLILRPDASLVPPRTLHQMVPVFIRWFRLIRRRSEETCRSYQTNLVAFLAFCDRAGLAHPDDVKVQHIEIFMGDLMENCGLQPVSANHHLHALRSFWKWMQREEITLKDPAAQAFLLKQAKRLPVFLPVGEQDRLLAVLARDHSLAGRRDQALHMMALYSGLRCGELASLQLEQVDLDGGLLRVVGKGNKEREVPLASQLVPILRDYLERARPALLGDETCSYLFVRVHRCGRRNGMALDRRSIWRIVRKNTKEILGKNLSPHKLRHSFASRVREHGGTLQDLQEVMGHVNIATTARYAHLVTSSQRQRMAELIQGKTTEGKRNELHR